VRDADPNTAGATLEENAFAYKEINRKKLKRRIEIAKNLKNHPLDHIRFTTAERESILKNRSSSLSERRF
jgi:hypothetical protein